MPRLILAQANSRWGVFSPSRPWSTMTTRSTPATTPCAHRVGPFPRHRRLGRAVSAAAPSRPCCARPPSPSVRWERDWLWWYG